MKATYIVGGVLVLLIIAIVAFLLLAPSNQISTNNETQDTSQILPTENQTTGNVAEETVETIELSAVAPYTGSGTANRSFNETNFINLVTAKIGPPMDGKFYEGWLIKDGVPFSMGKMLAESREYVLLFTSETDYSDYNEVVITEETESLGFDGKPEIRVLEGSFQ